MPHQGENYLCWVNFPGGNVNKCLFTPHTVPTKDQRYSLSRYCLLSQWVYWGYLQAHVEDVKHLNMHDSWVAISWNGHTSMGDVSGKWSENSLFRLQAPPPMTSAVICYLYTWKKWCLLSLKSLMNFPRLVCFFCSPGGNLSIQRKRSLWWTSSNMFFCTVTFPLYHPRGTGPYFFNLVFTIWLLWPIK